MRGLGLAMMMMTGTRPGIFTLIIMELTLELALCPSHDLERVRKNIDEFILRLLAPHTPTATTRQATE